MQTFLPFPSFRASAAVLDYRRLGKQRVEALLMLQIIFSSHQGTAWIHHPAVRMWRPYAGVLAVYGIAICDEWIRRGYVDRCRPRIAEFLDPAVAGAAPPWLGDQRLHRSHQSNLVRKYPQYYGPLFPDVPCDLPYYWPVEPPARTGSIKTATAGGFARAATS